MSGKEKKSASTVQTTLKRTSPIRNSQSTDTQTQQTTAPHTDMISHQIMIMAIVPIVLTTIMRQPSSQICWDVSLPTVSIAMKDDGFWEVNGES